MNENGKVSHANLAARYNSESFLRRLVAGISGQVFGRLVLAGATVVWLPLMLRTWGTSGYGEWMAVTSLASYLSYSNFGLVTPSANEIVMAIGANDADRARRQLGMAISCCLFVVAPILFVAALWMSTMDFQTKFNFVFLTNAECVSIITAMVWGILMLTLRGVAVAALYAQGAYGQAYFTSGLLRLAELMIVSALLLFWRVIPSTIAWVTAATSTLDLLVVAYFAKRLAPWVSFRPQRLNAKWLLHQLRPTIGFILSNLATQGVLLNGPRVVLSAVSGGGPVAVYAFYCTVMRLVDQVVFVFVMPLEVEMARSVGMDDVKKTSQLVQMGTHSSWVVFVVISLAIAAVGPFAFPVWTRGQIAFDYPILGLVCTMFASNQFGRVSAHALIATNRLYGPSFLMLAWSLISLGLGGLLSVSHGVEGMFLGVWNRFENSVTRYMSLIPSRRTGQWKLHAPMGRQFSKTHSSTNRSNFNGRSTMLRRVRFGCCGLTPTRLLRMISPMK